MEDKRASLFSEVVCYENAEEKIDRVRDWVGEGQRVGLLTACNKLDETSCGNYHIYKRPQNIHR